MTGTLRFTRPTMFTVALFSLYLSITNVGWVKEQRDVPVRSVLCHDGYAALYPSYTLTVALFSLYLSITNAGWVKEQRDVPVRSVPSHDGYAKLYPSYTLTVALFSLYSITSAGWVKEQRDVPIRSVPGHDGYAALYPSYNVYCRLATRITSCRPLTAGAAHELPRSGQAPARHRPG